MAAGDARARVPDENTFAVGELQVLHLLPHVLRIRQGIPLQVFRLPGALPHVHPHEWPNRRAHARP
eukprot:9821812-Alexandrium_andersonii.AAC.1